MTEHDAIKHLSYKIAFYKSIDTNWADGVNVAALEMANRALQKQEPQKVIKTDIGYIYKCPSCGKDVNGRGYYCWNCGQRLEWNDK